METAKAKKKKVDDLAYEDEQDWESLSVYPMSQASSKKYASSVWDFFGHLMRDSICVDNKNFYCLPCFQLHKLKQYSVSTATSNFYTHLKAYHSIMPERGLTYKKKKIVAPKMEVIQQSTSDDERQEQQEPQQQQHHHQHHQQQQQAHQQYELGHFTEVLDNDALNELIVVGGSNNRSSSQVKDELNQTTATEVIVTEAFPKKKFGVHQRRSANRKIPISFINQPTTTHHQQSPPRKFTTATIKYLDEQLLEKSEDYDRLFILSLVKEFRKVPEEYRLDAKYDLLGVLKKYQQFSQTQHIQQHIIHEVEEHVDSRQESSDKYEQVEQYG